MEVVRGIFRLSGHESAVFSKVWCLVLCFHSTIVAIFSHLTAHQAVELCLAEDVFFAGRSLVPEVNSGQLRLFTEFEASYSLVN